MRVPACTHTHTSRGIRRDLKASLSGCELSLCIFLILPPQYDMQIHFNYKCLCPAECNAVWGFFKYCAKQNKGRSWPLSFYMDVLDVFEYLIWMFYTLYNNNLRLCAYQENWGFNHLASFSLTSSRPSHKVQCAAVSGAISAKTTSWWWDVPGGTVQIL